MCKDVLTVISVKLKQLVRENNIYVSGDMTFILFTKLLFLRLAPMLWFLSSPSEDVEIDSDMVSLLVAVD